jgi:hypothetical protein
VWCGVVVFSTDNNTTPTKVVLSCFGLLVGLWQFVKCQLKNMFPFEQIGILIGKVDFCHIFIDSYAG